MRAAKNAKNLRMKKGYIHLHEGGLKKKKVLSNPKRLAAEV